MRRGSELTLAQVIMAANTPMLLRSGLVDGKVEAGVLASGQVVGVLDDLPSCEELITGMVEQAKATLTRLGSL
jgi:NAD(P)H-dependent flavin oxidoreductase YrpB (nitropropane dioxygenase family)